MVNFLTIQFDPIRGQPGEFITQLLGSFTDPLLAMLSLQITEQKSLYKGGHPPICILFEFEGHLHPDDKMLQALLRSGTIPENSGLTPIGVKTDQTCIFLNFVVQYKYELLLTKLNALDPIHVRESVRKDWASALEKNDSSLQRLLDNPRYKMERPKKRRNEDGNTPGNKL